MARKATHRHSQCWDMLLRFTYFSAGLYIFYNQRTWQRHTSSNHKTEKNSIKQFTKRIFEDALTWAQGLLLSHTLQNKLSPLAFKEITALELDHLYQLAGGWLVWAKWPCVPEWERKKATISLGKLSARKFLRHSLEPLWNSFHITNLNFPPFSILRLRYCQFRLGLSLPTRKVS